MFFWNQDRKKARQAAEILVAAHGRNAYAIAFRQMTKDLGKASRMDCMIYSEVKRLLGMRTHQDTATRYLERRRED